MIVTIDISFYRKKVIFYFSMLPFLLFHSFATNEEDSPDCTITYNVIDFRSEVIRKRIPPNSSYCIRSYSNDVYDGKLAFVFNKLSGIDPVLYIPYPYSGLWTVVKGKSDDGGAATGSRPGLLYLKNKGKETVEINVAYTTFFRHCDEYFISGKPKEKIDLSGDYSSQFCYFNGINGGMKFETHTGSSSLCRGMLYPQMKKQVYLDKYPIKANIDQGSIQFLMYSCSYSVDEEKSTITVKANEDSDSYVHSEVYFIDPKFYPREHANNKGVLIGLGVGGGVLFIIMVLSVIFANQCCFECDDGTCDCVICDCDYGYRCTDTQCTCDCFDNRCKCGRICHTCNCKCDMTINKYKERIINDYSYSDDRPEDVPEFRDDAVP